jgi:hypothetical protein
MVCRTDTEKESVLLVWRMKRERSIRKLEIAKFYESYAPW